MLGFNFFHLTKLDEIKQLQIICDEAELNLVIWQKKLEHARRDLLAAKLAKSERANRLTST